MDVTTEGLEAPCVVLPCGSKVELLSGALLLGVLYFEAAVGVRTRIEALLLALPKGLVFDDSADEGDVGLAVVVSCGGVAALGSGTVVAAVERAGENGVV